MAALRPRLAGASVDVSSSPVRPPLPATASRDLFRRAARIASQLGLPELKGVTVGGGSDGNLTASVGTPTLDGLGPVGGGAHATHEHVNLPAMPSRAALLAELVTELRARPTRQGT
jgi:glutamate carboxypeptidase